MDQLIQQIVQKTGVSEEKVREMLPMVAQFLKGKLPAVAAPYVDQYLPTAPAAGGDAPEQQAAGGGGGMMDALKQIPGLGG